MLSIIKYGQKIDVSKLLEENSTNSLVLDQLEKGKQIYIQIEQNVSFSSELTNNGQDVTISFQKGTQIFQLVLKDMAEILNSNDGEELIKIVKIDDTGNTIETFAITDLASATVAAAAGGEAISSSQDENPDNNENGNLLGTQTPESGERVDGFGGEAESAQTISPTFAYDITFSGDLSGNSIEDYTDASGVLLNDDPNYGTQEYVNETIDGLYGTFSIDLNGNWTYVLDNTKIEVQSLAQGDTLSETFTAQLDSLSFSQNIEIVITGTNDQPEVTAVDINANGVIVEEEESGLNTNSFTAALVTVEDVDSSDTHTYQIYETQDFPISVDNSKIELSTTSIIVNENGTFSISGDFNALTEGETATLSFYYTATDNQGIQTANNGNELSQSEPKLVTVTITGTNDAPEFKTSDAVIISGSEDAAVGVIEGLSGTVSGEFDFASLVSDVDHEEVDFQISTINGIAVDETTGWSETITFSYVDKEGNPASLTADLSINAEGEYIITNIGDLNPIPNGSTATATLSFKVADSDGVETDTSKSVEITISGENDAPVINAVNPELEVNEIDFQDNANTGVNNYYTVISAADIYASLNITDVDSLNVGLSLTNNSSSFSEDGSDITDSDTNGVFQLSQAQYDSNPTGWDSVGAEVGDFVIYSEQVDGLNDSESIEASFLVRAYDGEDYSEEKSVTVKINGSSDAPEFKTSDAVIISGSEDAAVGVIEGLSGTVSGEFDFASLVSDVDHEEVDFQISTINGIAVDETTGWSETITFSYVDKEGNPASLTADLSINAEGEYIITNIGDLNPIPNGSTATATLSFKVADSDGVETDTSKSVEITISGENDAPVINAVNPELEVNEIDFQDNANTGVNNYYTVISAADIYASLNITDVDSLNVGLSLTNNSSSFSEDGSDITDSDTNGVFQLSQAQYDSNPTGWDSVGAEVGDFVIYSEQVDGLNDSESIEASFLVRAYDGEDYSEEKSVTVKINGSSDSLSASATDGYISGMTVFSDLDNDSVLDTDETSAQTNISGEFTLSGGTLSGTLVGYGGVDISTGLNFEGMYKAPAGNEVLTPMTTIIAELMLLGKTEIEAKNLVYSYGLDTSIDLLIDPIEAATNAVDGSTEQENYILLQSINVQVNNVASQIAAAIDGAGYTDETSAFELVFKEIAKLIVSGTDFLAEEGLEELINNTLETLGETSDNASVTENLVDIILNLNTAIENAATDSSNSTAEDALKAIAKVQIVAEQIEQEVENEIKNDSDLSTTKTNSDSSSTVFIDRLDSATVGAITKEEANQIVGLEEENLKDNLQDGTISLSSGETITSFSGDSLSGSSITVTEYLSLYDDDNQLIQIETQITINPDGTYTIVAIDDIDIIPDGQIASANISYETSEGISSNLIISVEGSNEAPQTQDIVENINEENLDDIEISSTRDTDTTFEGQLNSTDVDSDSLTYSRSGTNLGLTITSTNPELIAAISTSNLDYVKQMLIDIITIPEITTALTNDIDSVPTADLTTLSAQFSAASTIQEALSVLNSTLNLTGASISIDSNGVHLSATDVSSLETEGLLNVEINSDGSYSVTSPLFNYLSSYDSIEVKFDYISNDGIEDSNVSIVSLNIDGTNDAPVINAIDPVIEIDEIDFLDNVNTGVNNYYTVISAADIYAALNITDADTDNIGLSLTNNSSSFSQDGSDITDSNTNGVFQLSQAQYDSNPTGWDSVGAVVGDFVIYSEQVDGLSENENIEASFLVRAYDGENYSEEKSVTVSIDGTNDAPVINAIDPVIEIDEIDFLDNANTGVNNYYTVISAADIYAALNITDDSASVGLSLTNNSSSFSQDGSDITDANTNGVFQLSQAQYDSNPTGWDSVGAVVGDFVIYSEQVDGLSENENIEASFLVRAYDGENYSEEKSVTVSIDGSTEVQVTDGTLSLIDQAGTYSMSDLLGAIPSNTQVDTIDLEYTGEHILSNISIEDFIAISDDDTLIINRENEDHVNIDSSIWSQALGEETQVIDDTTYDKYQATDTSTGSTLTLLIEQDQNLPL